MARAIIRYSMNGEKSNETGNAVGKILKDAYFVKAGRTACYEADGVSAVEAVKAIKRALDLLATPPGGGRPDHVWVYVDR